MNKYMIYILPFSIDAILITAAIIGSFHYKKYKRTPLKYFLFFFYGMVSLLKPWELFCQLFLSILITLFIIFIYYSIPYSTFGFLVNILKTKTILKQLCFLEG